MSRIAVIALSGGEAAQHGAVAKELARHLSDVPSVESTLVRPPLRMSLGDDPPTATARALGRFAQLPLELGITSLKADHSHIADHSYAHLALLFHATALACFDMT